MSREYSRDSSFFVDRSGMENLWKTAREMHHKKPIFVSKNFEHQSQAAFDMRHLLEEFRCTTSEGTKYDDEKARLDLVSPIALHDLGLILAHGAKKYGPNNWRKGLSWGRLIAAALRHLIAYMRGEDNDPESGFPHVSHALCNLMMLVEFHHTRRDLDDRWRGINESV